MTIKEKVIAAASDLKEMDVRQLRVWSQKNEMDNRSAFPRFKKELLEIGIDYGALGREARAGAQNELESRITHHATLITDAKGSNDKFAICDKNGNVIWYGCFFEKGIEQSDAELEAAKKAVWLAGKIKDAVGADVLKLTLKTDANWLKYQDKFKQKGSVLSYKARQNDIVLDVVWIPGKSNPADKWTVEKGFKKWQNNDLSELATKI